MALKARSLILYGYEINEFNTAIDFKNASGGPEIQASLNAGFYSLTTLCTEIKRAMEAADPANVYTVTANRTYVGGLENRVTIATTTGVFLSLLFGTGTRNGSSIAPIIGFAHADRTGALTYTGVQTTGTAYRPETIAYSYRGPDVLQLQDGVRTLSASGIKETIVFASQNFVELRLKHLRDKTACSNWLVWATQQKPFEITPEFSTPGVFHNVTLDKTPKSDTGMAFELEEQVSMGMPGYWDTGLLRSRIIKG